MRLKLGSDVPNDHETVSSTNTCSSGTEISSSDDGDASESYTVKLERLMDRDSHRDSFLDHSIHYYECLKVTSLWFKQDRVLD
jgi:hypothetical protein